MKCVVGDVCVCVCVQDSFLEAVKRSPQINNDACRTAGFSAEEGFYSHIKSSCFPGQHVMINEINWIVYFYFFIGLFFVCFFPSASWCSTLRFSQ